MKITRFILGMLLLSACSMQAQTSIQPAFVDSVVMRDGKKIVADIYIPDNGSGQQYPAILIQTPYNRLAYRNMGLPLFGMSLVGKPYAVVIADWRCFYGSAAACAGNYDRANDGYDLVEWIALQPWSNGKVGTWGPSALGRIQFMTARKKPPHLVCAVPLVAGPQYNYQEYFPGGVFRTEYVEQLDALGFGMSATLLAHPVFDNLWQYSELTTFYPDSIQIPMLMIGGWYDHNPVVMTAFFDALRTSSPVVVRNKHRLLMGPWTHGGHGTAGIGNPQQGQLFYYGAVGWSDSLALLHFDYYLRNIANDWNVSPVVQYFQMGENTWQQSPQWPPSGTQAFKLYLHSDGSLKPEVPSDSGLLTEFTDNPSDPSPTVGGSTLRADLDQGPYDQAPLVESRGDISVFTTPVLSVPVVLRGSSRAVIYVSSDRRDGDVAVRLTDVYPDGRSMLLFDGIRRLRFRNGFLAVDTSCILPGEVYQAEIQLPPTAITFMPGHRIRLDVSGANYPRFDCNLNNGKTMYAAGDTLTSSMKIHCNNQYSSFVELPLISYPVSAEIPDPLQNRLQVFPNPSTGSFTLSFYENNSRNAIVTLKTIGGERVIEQKLTDLPDSGFRTFDVRGLPPGMYILEFITENQCSVLKIILTNP